MNETSLPETEINLACRLGRVAGLIVLAKMDPGAIERVPEWVRTCLRQLGEAMVQGGGNAVGGVFAESPGFTPHSAGFALGNIGSMVNIVRTPEEGAKGNIKPWIDEYFRAYFEVVFRGQPAPSNIWHDFAQEIFGLFIGGNYEQRLDFIEGARLGSELEKTFRSGDTRETTATRIYMELLLFWPEVTRMGKLSAVYAFLQLRFKDSLSQLGEFERFRKLANRIELSFQDR